MKRHRGSNMRYVIPFVLLEECEVRCRDGFTVSSPS